MATLIWQPKAIYRPRIETAQVSTYDAATTYSCSINGVSFSVPGTTDASGTAAALATLLGDSDHPYFSSLVFEVTTDTITVTASHPFVITWGATGGTGAWTEADVQTLTSPNDAADSDNWGGSTPANNDTLVFRNSPVYCLWNLDLNLTGLTLVVERSYTGRIGLTAGAFTTTATGSSRSTLAPEYRDHQLQSEFAAVTIGAQLFGQSVAAGPEFVSVYNERSSSSSCQVDYIGHQAVSTDATIEPAFLYRAIDDEADVLVRDAPGGVGLALAAPGETGTYGDIRQLPGASFDSWLAMSDGVTIGNGTSLGNVVNQAGQMFIRAAANILSLTVTANVGRVTIEGSGYGIITATIGPRSTVYYDGAVNIPTITLAGGTLDASRSAAVRATTTLNYQHGTLFTGANWTISGTTWSNPRQVISTEL